MIWRLLLALVPTCVVQDALSRREGIETILVGPEDHVRFWLRGPLVVTINRD